LPIQKGYTIARRGQNVSPSSPFGREKAGFRSRPYGVMVWIDNYCRANPLKLIANAGIAFVEAQPRRAIG